MLTEFQKAKLVEWAEWRIANGPGPMPCGIAMVHDWAFGETHFGDPADPFPTREQFAERQNRVTFEAI